MHIPHKLCPFASQDQCPSSCSAEDFERQAGCSDGRTYQTSY